MWTSRTSIGARSRVRPPAPSADRRRRCVRPAREFVWSMNWDSCEEPKNSFSAATTRSEEHTSELQSRSDLVCRLLLEKKKRTHRTCHRTDTRLTIKNGALHDRRPRTEPCNTVTGDLHPHLHAHL